MRLAFRNGAQSYFSISWYGMALSFYLIIYILPFSIFYKFYFCGQFCGSTFEGVQRRHLLPNNEYSFQAYFCVGSVFLFICKNRYQICDMAEFRKTYIFLHWNARVLLNMLQIETNDVKAIIFQTIRHLSSISFYGPKSYHGFLLVTMICNKCFLILCTLLRLSVKLKFVIANNR